MFRCLFLTYVFLLTPYICFGAVSISEIAWMGSESSANHEWIELVNNGSTPVVLDGWELHDANTLQMILEGTIGASEYVVLERNRSDGQYLFTPPFFIYTGALVNTGTTLTLRNNEGVIVDQVVGGENWESIGGNNATKDTAQYSGTRWVTAPATPGSSNATSDSAPVTSGATISSGASSSNTNSTNTKKSSATTGANKKTAPLELPNDTLRLSMEMPDVVYVNQRVSFAVEPSGLTSTPVTNSLTYSWNFGDLHSTSGKSASHRYAYPGEYVVSVYATYARHEQVARKTITVLPVQFSLTKNEHGDIQLHNDAPYEVLLDGYVVKQGKIKIPFPKRTVMLPRSTITIPRARLSVASSFPVTLHDAKGLLVATIQTNQHNHIAPNVVLARQSVYAPVEPVTMVAMATEPTIQADRVVVATARGPEETVPASQFVFHSEVGSATPIRADTTFSQDQTVLARAVEIRVPNDSEEIQSRSVEAPTPSSSPKTSPSRNMWPFLGLMGLIVLGVSGLYVTRQKKAFDD